MARVRKMIVCIKKVLIFGVIVMSFLLLTGCGSSKHSGESDNIVIVDSDKAITFVKAATAISSGEVSDATGQKQLANKTVYKAEKSDFTIWDGSKSISLYDREDVINLKGILGKPKSEKTEQLGPGSDTFNGSFVKKLSYDGIELQLFAPKGNEKAFWIYGIVVTGKGFTTVKGFRVDNSLSELKKLYPNIETAKDGRQDENNCAYETSKSDECSYLTFEIKGGEIIYDKAENFSQECFCKNGSSSIQ